jgi:hypothetical protein
MSIVPLLANASFDPETVETLQRGERDKKVLSDAAVTYLAKNYAG